MERNEIKGGTGGGPDLHAAGGQGVQVRGQLREVRGLVPDVSPPHVVDQEEKHVRLARRAASTGGG